MYVEDITLSHEMPVSLVMAYWIGYTTHNNILTYVNSLKLHEAYIDGSVQDCSNSIANALELLQYCKKPSIYVCILQDHWFK